MESSQDLREGHELKDINYAKYGEFVAADVLL